MCIVLKPTTAADYEDYYTIRCSPSDIYWNGYEKAPDKETFRNIFLERLGNAPLNRPEDRRLYLIQRYGESVGFLQLIRREDGIDIGYTIIECFQRKGYATAALKEGIKLAKEHNRNIYVQIRDDNIASQRVALKCGFKYTDEVTKNIYPKVGEVKLRKYRLCCDIENLNFQ